jgi:acyl phosphate:glycerol-3-phosphate acyltransferase
MNWLLLPLTYLLGSISFAWLAAKAKGIDLRQHGSGNLGATNAGRVLGRKWFFLIFTADLAKGLIPVLIALALVEHNQASATLPVLTAACAILGHSFTCFHGFKGGKAVATSLGVLIGLVYITAAITFCIWILVWALGYTLFRLKASDAVGPASIVASLAMPFAHLATYPNPWLIINLPLTIFLFLVSALVIVRHRSNIAKLMGKTSPN